MSFCGELQLKQVSLDFKISCYNLKIGDQGVNVRVWLFYYLSFERNHNVLKLKRVHA